MENTKQLMEQLLERVDEIGADNMIVALIQMLSEEDGNGVFGTSSMMYEDSKEKRARLFESAEIDFEKNFAVGITFGGVPEVVWEKEYHAFREFILTTFLFYNRIEKELVGKGLGFEIYRTAHMLHMIGVFPREHEKDFVEVYLKPLQDMVEETYSVKLCLGVGMQADSKAQLNNAYRTAKYAHELYFFHQQPIIEFQKLEKKFERSRDEYEEELEEALHEILIKSPHALEKIEHMVDVIAEIHYGNWQAVLMRIMGFTGDLTSKLQRYNLFRGDFYKIQDELQGKILNCKTLSRAKEIIHEYYGAFLPYIYSDDRASSKVTVEKVKNYIQENFMEEMSIQSLSEVACVSPNYFSHMFKNEVGVNYKEYLTGIRMEKALDLILNTDYPMYRIAESVGYNNARAFVEAFKNAYGDSPTKYKKKVKTEEE